MEATDALKRRAVALAAFLAACATHPEVRPLPQTVVGRTPVVTRDATTGDPEIRIRVLTYNVAALPWPARKGTLADLERIGREIRAMRDRGEGPDVLLLQEAFLPEAGRIVELAGFPNFVRGPETEDPPATTLAGLEGAKILRPPRVLRGEDLGKWLSGGLYVASDFPILERKSAAFRACAGIDCLSNKGVVLVRLAVPGLPVPLEVFTTHMNSRVNAGVPAERSSLAHAIQVDEIEAFLDEHRDPRLPLVFGGDFNTGGAFDRFEYAARRWLSHVVDEYCAIESGNCDVRMSYDGDEPWLDTQDLQGFLDGDRVRVRPVRVEARFDAPLDGRMLSDHDGYFVEYRLAW